MKLHVEFAHNNCGEIIVLDGNDAKIIKMQDIELINKIFENIATNYVEAFEALSFIYKSSATNRMFFRFLIVKRFIKCNFGNLDTKEWDYLPDGSFRFEKVFCPLRGECKHEGIVCNPKRKTGLSNREEEVVALALQGFSAKEMADKLHISTYTLNVHLKHIFQKLNLKSVKQLICNFHGQQNSISPQ